MVKVILLLTCFIVIGIDGAYAHDRHDAPRETSDKGVGIAATQLNFDWSTKALQLSVGFGNDGSSAIGIGKRFDRILINGSVMDEGAGVGFTMRFK